MTPPPDLHNKYTVDAKNFYQDYSTTIKLISLAEVCIFDVTIHNIGLGRIMQEAIRREKPVIALYHQNHHHQSILEAQEQNVEPKVQILTYNSDTLKDILKYSFELATEMLNSRFTMLIPPDLNRYLNQLYQKEGLNRSEYIRNLIRKDMKKRKPHS